MKTKNKKYLACFSSEIFIENVCLSYNHGFGLMAEQGKQTLRFECKEWMRAISNNFIILKTKDINKMENKKTSQKGIALIKEFEGVRYKAYKDVAGLDTIAVGHLIKKNEPELLKKVLTENEVDEILKKDLLISESCINNYVKVALNQNQFDALVSLVFNIGGGNFKNSTLLKYLNNKNYGTTIPASGAAGQFLVWNKAGGKVIEGLKKRRLAESTLFSQK